MTAHARRVGWNDPEIAELMAGVPIVDAHVHYWASDGPVRRSPGPFFDLLEGAELPSEYLPSMYELDRGTLPISAAIYVEMWAEYPEEELNWLDSILSTNTIPTAIVAGVELQSKGAPAALEKLAETPAVVGVRQILGAHSNAKYAYITRDNLMEEPSWRRAFARLSRLGLAFDVQVYPAQLQQVSRLAAEYSETVIVVDHVGMPVDRDDESIRHWQRGLRALASMPNVYVKISGIAMVDHAWTDASVDRVVEPLLKMFGTSRLMFGSNFPVDSPFGYLRDMVASIARGTTGLTFDERRQLFGGTAWRAYQLQEVLETGDRTMNHEVRPFASESIETYREERP